MFGLVIDLFQINFRVASSAVERFSDKEEVEGSTPSPPNNLGR